MLAPSVIASRAESIARDNTVLFVTSPAVCRALVIGKPPASSVERVFENLAIAMIRIVRPITGNRSLSPSKASRPRSVAMIIRNPMPAMITKIAIAHHQLRAKSEAPMMMTVARGNSWFRLISNSEICGRTTVTSTPTTTNAKRNITLG